MPGWIGNQAEAPIPGDLARQEIPELTIVDVTPEAAVPETGMWGHAYCPHCEMVVDREQALVRGPLLDTENDPRYSGRPVIAHRCKQARGVVHLYCDNE